MDSWNVRNKFTNFGSFYISIPGKMQYAWREIAHKVSKLEYMTVWVKNVNLVILSTTAHFETVMIREVF